MNEAFEKDMGMGVEVSFLDYVVVLIKRMKLIFKITVWAAVCSIVVSLIIPETFEGTARIVPPQQASGSLSAALLSQIPAGLGSLAGLAGGTGTPSEYYTALLQSRTITDAIIHRFGLMELYGEDTLVDTREALFEVFRAESDTTNPIVTIRVEDEDPQRAADMANSFVDELVKLDRSFAATDASQRRHFFDVQLKGAHESLMRAEDAVRSFQEETGAIKIDEQAGAVLEGIATLKAQIAAKEVQIKVMKTYATPFNRGVRQVEEELAGLNQQLQKLETAGESDSARATIPTSEIPGVATEYLRRVREFKFQETLFELLTKQYESARLDEANNMSTIQIVDTAVVPDKKVKPRRTLIVVLSTVLGFLFAIIVAFSKEYWEELSQDPDNSDRLMKMKEYFASVWNHPAIARIRRLFEKKS